MSGSNVDEISKQTRRKKTEPAAWGRGRKDKSHDALANIEARLAKVKVAMVGTQERVDLIKAWKKA